MNLRMLLEAFKLQAVLDIMNEFNLTGIESADIRVTGDHIGGYTVALENIQYAQ